MVEKCGGHLFKKIKGDYFTIIGFPIFDVVKFLRKRGMGVL
jgi:predicted house-cleaning NTP pyrophosphatase (Maf/HAM1 superfamily)